MQLSDFHSKLKTNDSLTEQERMNLASLLSPHKSRLAWLRRELQLVNNEISDRKKIVVSEAQQLNSGNPRVPVPDWLVTRVQRLETKSLKVQTEIEVCSSIIICYINLAARPVPIFRLPNAVLKKIFMHCLPEDYPPYITFSQAPLLLLLVCKSWYKTAANAPALWTRIHVIVPTTATYAFLDNDGMLDEGDVLHFPILCNQIQPWLSRGGSLPLEISIFGRGVTAQDILIFWQVFRTIYPFRQRWRKVMLHFHSNLLSSWINSIDGKDLELLEEFLVSEMEAMPPEPSIVPEGQRGGSFNLTPALDHWTSRGRQNLWYAPKLRRLVVLGAKECPPQAMWATAWEKLTHLEFCQFGEAEHVATPDSIFQALKLCTSLVKCRIQLLESRKALTLRRTSDRDNRLRGGVHSGLSSISLPFLEFLQIRDGSFDLTPYFSAMNVPSLKHLLFRHDVRWEWDIMNNSTATQNDPVLDYGIAFDRHMTCLMPLLRHASKTLESLDVSTEFFHREKLIEYFRLCPRLNSLKIGPSCTFPRAPSYPRLALDDAFLQSLIRGDLLPNLEDLFVWDGDYFTEKGLLDFVIRKQNLSGGVKKLKRLTILFGKPRSSDGSEGAVQQAALFGWRKLDEDAIYRVLGRSYLRGWDQPQTTPSLKTVGISQVRGYLRDELEKVMAKPEQRLEMNVKYEM